VGLGIVLRSPQCLRVDHVHLELLPIESHEACGWTCLSFVDTCKLWREGVYDAEESTAVSAGAAA
jgi:hypothetical protein